MKKNGFLRVEKIFYDFEIFEKKISCNPSVCEGAMFNAAFFYTVKISEKSEIETFGLLREDFRQFERIDDGVIFEVDAVRLEHGNIK